MIAHGSFCWKRDRETSNVATNGPAVRAFFQTEILRPDMGASFTEDQLGKRVVSQSGSDVGFVSDVRDGSLYVEVEADPDPEVVDHLGWTGPVNQTVHHLNRRYISTITDDAIRLRV